MLILTRRQEEAVVIETSDGPVTVVVLGYDRGKVKLGFAAPDCVTILREELVDCDALRKHKARRTIDATA